MKTKGDYDAFAAGIVTSGRAKKVEAIAADATIRTTTARGALEVNDVLSFDGDIILEYKAGNRPYYSTIVTLNREGGETLKEFFFGTLTKTAVEFDIDRKEFGSTIRANGGVTRWWEGHTRLTEAWEGLKGRAIKVTGVTKVTGLKYESRNKDLSEVTEGDLETIRIYRFEFVDNKATKPTTKKAPKKAAKTTTSAAGAE